MQEVILCKYGELLLKGANRKSFEAALLKELRRRASQYGKFKIYERQSTIYIEPCDEYADIAEMFESAKKVFGIVAVNRAAVAEKSMDAILRVAKDYLADKLADCKSFKVEAKRSDKRFPLGSPEIAREVGGAVLSVLPHLKVDVHTPDTVVRVEIREENAYVHAGQQKGAGGMPPRSGGKGLLLLSGGIDSPVAGYMMAKRGMDIEALHFESSPYTGAAAHDKVMTLAKKLVDYTSRMYVHVISLTHIQEEIRDHCDEDYFTILLRIFMMRLAERTARSYHAGALITGESLGQVASQTLAAIGVTDSVVTMPVFRPCIGMDKEEIVQVARKIDTFETSILPFEDCCTIFTPRHPKTRPHMEDVSKELSKLDVEALLDEAYANMETETFLLYDGYSV